MTADIPHPAVGSHTRERSAARRVAQHGVDPERSRGSALLIVDMVNPSQFPGAERLLGRRAGGRRGHARLRAALAPQGVPTIFVNNNFGF